MCSPERRDNALLWRRDAENNLVFNHNSSIQESNNNFISGESCKAAVFWAVAMFTPTANKPVT